MNEERRVQLPPIWPETRFIEAVKQHVAVASDGSRSTKPLEEVLRDRLRAHPDEQLADDPWLAEQAAPARWLVSLSFRRRGRPQTARWEVDEATGEIRYLDPDAKAMSIG